MPFRLRLLAAGAAGCVAAALAGIAGRSSLPLGPRFPATASAIVAALTAAAIVLPDEHPFDRIGPANVVTIVRATIVALLGSVVFEPRSPLIAWTAVVATTVAAILDGVDGWLARRTRLASAFGARIDMETDALLILILSVLVWLYGKAGVWVLAGGVMRYAFVASGRAFPWMAAPLTPTLRAKTITVCHIVGLCVALAPIVPWPLSAIAVGSTVIALAWSFGVDVRRLWAQEKRRNGA